MADKEDVEDPLKLFDEIYEPDKRQAHFTGTLEDIHAELSTIILHDSVPLDVEQLFETAKNLSLYSWFVYRFHQVSELIAFTALEMALRERYLTENQQLKSGKPPRGLHQLMQHAKKEKWITNEGFPSMYQQAKRLAEYRKAIDITETHDFDKEPSTYIGEPSDKEIGAALADLDMVEAVTSTAHKIRNNLAHGSRTLHPGSVSTLRTNAEIINQLFNS